MTFGRLHWGFGWAELPNAKIASGFIQVHCIVAQVIKATTNSLVSVAHPMLESAKIFTIPMMTWFGKTAKHFLLLSKKLYLKLISFIEAFILFYIVMHLIIVSNEC
jgi:hypothetical protein